MICRYRGREECMGIAVASFGAGLIAARLIPYTVTIILVAAALIVMGTFICRH